MTKKKENTNEAAEQEQTVFMKGYKGFSKGLICRDKQYAENTVFEEDAAEICHSGMHFCENPFDVLDYYPLIGEKGEPSEFAEVEALDEAKTDDRKKYCTKKLKVGAKLSLSNFINACVDFTIEKTKKAPEESSAGNYAQIGSSGKHSVICCAGNGCTVKAKKGNWITLAEWNFIDNEVIPVCVKTEQVDGERIKEDTFYKLENGEFVETES